MLEMKVSQKEQLSEADVLIPIDKVADELIRQLLNEPIPQLEIPYTASIQEALDIYYKQYQRLFAQNQALNDDLTSVLSERNILTEQYNRIKVIFA